MRKEFRVNSVTLQVNKDVERYTVGEGEVQNLICDAEKKIVHVYYADTSAKLITGFPFVAALQLVEVPDEKPQAEAQVQS